MACGGLLVASATVVLTFAWHFDVAEHQATESLAAADVLASGDVAGERAFARFARSPSCQPNRGRPPATRGCTSRQR